MRPYEEMGQVMDKIRDKADSELVSKLWTLVYDDIRKYIISPYTWVAEDKILEDAKKAREKVKEVAGLVSTLPEEGERLLELINIQLSREGRILQLADQIELKKQKKIEEEALKKKEIEKVAKIERESELAWMRKLLKKAKTYTPDKFKSLYKKFTQIQADEGEWFAYDAIAYLKWMQAHQENNEFPLDILSTTGFLIPPEHREQFVREFVCAVIQDAREDEDNDDEEDVNSEKYLKLTSKKMNWDII